MTQGKSANILLDVNAAIACASRLARRLETDLPEAALNVSLLLYAERAAECVSREASQIFGAGGFGAAEMRQLIIARALSQPLGAS